MNQKQIAKFYEQDKKKKRKKIKFKLKRKIYTNFEYGGKNEEAKEIFKSPVKNNKG